MHSANKDAEETEARLDVLTQDAATLIGEYKSAVDRRLAFAANVEDAMASAMIRLGKVLDEANMTTSPDGGGEPWCRSKTSPTPLSRGRDVPAFEWVRSG